jgi:hypothetical protein
MYELWVFISLIIEADHAFISINTVQCLISEKHGGAALEKMVQYWRLSS